MPSICLKDEELLHHHLHSRLLLGCNGSANAVQLHPVGHQRAAVQVVPVEQAVVRAHLDEAEVARLVLEFVAVAGVPVVLGGLRHFLLRVALALDRVIFFPVVASNTA